jgi:hypothetical protein
LHPVERCRLPLRPGVFELGQVTQFLSHLHCLISFPNRFLAALL